LFKKNVEFFQELNENNGRNIDFNEVIEDIEDIEKTKRLGPPPPEGFIKVSLKKI
jgi:hypothetical protein